MRPASRKISAAVWAAGLVLVILTSTASWAGTPAAADKQSRPDLPPGLDKLVERVLKTFQVPGAALAVVKDGRVLVAKGYGIRKLGDPAPVDSRTTFGIASNTKVFTATALGLLIEEGRIASWDAPVVDYFPEFMMYDPYVTREMTIRDLLVHRSGLGLGAGDLLWWPGSDYSRKELVKRLRYIKPATSFRSAYAYDNVLYQAAGELIERVTGTSWEDFVGSRILARVGMTGSTVKHSAAAAGGNSAATHAEVEGVVREVKPFLLDSVNPAGGINSSAEDMAKWMMVLLAGGKLPDGTRLFSERTARELMSIVTPIPFGNPAPELAPARMNFSGYGLGLRICDYRGHRVVSHTGGLPGYVSQVWLLPDLGLGIAVLTNQEATSAFESLTFQIADHYLNAPAFDWIDGFVKAKARVAAGMADVVKKAGAARNAAAGPSLPIEGYCGLYEDAWYGGIEVRLENGKPVMAFKHTPVFVGDMEHWQYDTFVVRWRDRELRADAYVTFSLGPNGKVAEARMEAVSPETDFSFDFQDLLLKPAGKK